MSDLRLISQGWKQGSLPGLLSMHRETYPAKWWRGWRREEKEPGEDNSAASWTSPLLPMLWIQQCQDPFLSLQKQAAHVLLYPPKRLKCCRPVGTELWWDSKHHHAASPLSPNYLLPRNLSPTCSHWFCTIHPSPECLCAQIRLCACTGTHTHQSLAHCWHHLPP